MSKPILSYVQYSFGGLCASGSVMEFVTRPLARSGFKFQPDSETLELYRSTYNYPHIIGCVSPINQRGVIRPTSAYFSNRTEEIRPRTKQRWLNFLSTGGTLRPESPFPLPDDWKEHGGKSFARLMETYLGANPDPCPRLAVLSADQKHMDPVLKAFLSIATDLSEPVEIKPKRAGQGETGVFLEF